MMLSSILFMAFCHYCKHCFRFQVLWWFLSPRFSESDDALTQIDLQKKESRMETPMNNPETPKP